MLEAIIAGVVEGLTEFLPISSTAHLMLAGSLLGAGAQPLLFIMVQLGAVPAALWCYRRPILYIIVSIFKGGEGRRVIVSLLLSMVPIVIAALFLVSSDIVGTYIGLMLSAGGVLLLIANAIAGDDKIKKIGLYSKPLSCEVKIWQAIVIGVAQVLAVIPGVSRSGATITAALLCGVRRSVAVEFSFLLGLLVISCSVFYPLLKYMLDGSGAYAELASSNIRSDIMISILCAFVTSLVAIRPSLRFISTRFGLFIVSCYRILLGVLVIFLL